jgi:hypothetical integral membrane protein (TIGR02206 family)
VEDHFSLFGPAHLAILGAIVGLTALLVWVARTGEVARERLRIGLAAALIANAAAWYGYLAMRGWLQFPHSLPLELCDATLVATVIALLTLKPLSVELAYYGACAGTAMALATPDLWEPFPSFGTVQFFVAHGLALAAALFLVGTRLGRPRPGSVARAMLALNAFAAAAGGFNAIFGTNYMYLRAKPASPSLLDYMGPWPWYILTAEAVALALFTLLWQPFRQNPRADGVEG